MVLFEINQVYGMPVDRDGSQQRVRYLGLEANEHRFIQIDKGAKKPFPVTEEEMHKSGWSVAQDPWLDITAVDDGDLSEYQKDVRARASSAIQQLHIEARRGFPGIRASEVLLNDERRRALERIVASKIGVRGNIVDRWLHRWWVRGMNANACLPDTGAMSGRGRVRCIPANECDKWGWPFDPGRFKAIGRKPKAGNPPSVRMSGPIRNKILTRGKELYLSHGKFSLHDAYILWKREPENRDVPANRFPSADSFRKLLITDPAVHAETRKRHLYGRKPRQKKPNDESTSTRVQGCGFRFQIDGTPPPIRIREEGTPHVIDNSTLYFVTDSCCKGIVGYHLGFGPERAVGYGAAFLNAVEPKVPFCAKHGKQIDSSEWPQHGVPEELVGDRGPLIGPIATPIVEAFHINLDNTVAYCPQQKADVEAAFGAMMRRLLSKLDDEMPRRAGRRISADGSLPILTVREFHRLMILFILAYNSRPLDRLPTPDEVASGVPTTPNGTWNREYDAHRGDATHVCEETAKIVISRPGDAKLDRSGLWFNNLLFRCEVDGVKEFQASLGEKSRVVRIRYDEDSTDAIVVQCRALKRVGAKITMPNQQFIRCELHQDNKEWAGYSFAALRAALATHGKVMNAARHQNDQYHGELLEAIAGKAEQPSPKPQPSAVPQAKTMEAIKDAERDEALVHRAQFSKVAESVPVPGTPVLVVKNSVLERDQKALRAARRVHHSKGDGGNIGE